VPALIGLVAVILIGGGWFVLRPSGGSHSSLRPTGVATSPAPSAEDPNTPPVITPAAAAAVVRSFWPAHEKALASGNLTALARMSAGPALRWEQATVACACRGVTKPRPMWRAKYFVRRQTSYPASFVAAVQMNRKYLYWTEVLVFTKASASARWLLTENSGVEPHFGTFIDLAGPAAAMTDFAPAPTAAQHQAAVKVAADLAGLWQQTKDWPSIPTSVFEVTGQTEDRSSSLAAYQQDATQRNGLLGHFTFSASRTDPLVDVAVDGNDLACQPLHETVVYEAGKPGQYVFQDAARHNWGPALAPGKYGAVVSTDEWQTCFLIPPRAAGPIQVLNQPVGGSVVRPYS